MYAVKQGADYDWEILNLINGFVTVLYIRHGIHCVVTLKRPSLLTALEIKAFM